MTLDEAWAEAERHSVARMRGRWLSRFAGNPMTYPVTPEWMAGLDDYRARWVRRDNVWVGEPAPDTEVRLP